MSRLDRLASALEEPLLVTKGVNVRYLTGLASSNAALLADPGGDHVLYTDFRYAQKARRVEGVRSEAIARDLVGDLAGLLAGRRIAVEGPVLPVADFERLNAGGVELVLRAGLVERLRAVKEPAELDAIRAAAAVSDRVFGALAGERFVGRTEVELAWRVRELFHEHGSSELSFPTMVAAAENGASPHSDNRDVPIPANTLVIVDAGCVVDGYISDCTRTFATGELDDDLAHVYEVCLDAQVAALEALRPGLSGRAADAVARDRIVAAGYGEHFGHGLGHGEGLEVHEAPTSRPESTDVLAAGHVTSCEPGIYLPGRGGVRIEDMVAITETGSERLTQVGKDLVTVS